MLWWRRPEAVVILALNLSRKNSVHKDNDVGWLLCLVDCLQGIHEKLRTINKQKLGRTEGFFSRTQRPLYISSTRKVKT